MGYVGVIVEESLTDKSILNKFKLVSSRAEKVTPRHKTPWLKQWTLHTIAIPETEAQDFAQEVSKALDKKRAWYVDYKNENFHYIIYSNKIFKADLKTKFPYEEARTYGINIGLPEYHLDFAV